jgi:hypothetical protein
MTELTRIVAAMIVAAALVAPAHADPAYTAKEALDNTILAWWAAANCPGIKTNEPKIKEQLTREGVTDGYDLQKAGEQEEIVIKRQLGVAEGTTIIPDVLRLCAAARDPSFPFHFLLDVEP